MVEINSVKEVIKDYIVKQLISMGDKVWEYFHMNN